MRHNHLWKIAALGGLYLVAGCSEQKQPFSSNRQSSWSEADPTAITAAEPEEAPEILPQTHFAAGQLFEKQGALTKAIVQYQRALDSDPDHVGALNRLGVIFSRVGRHKEAEASLLRAVELVPSSPYFRNNLGFEYVMQKRWDDAEAEFRNALSLKPDFGRARINMGMTLARVDRYHEAMQQFREVVPEPDAYYNLGLMLRAQGRYRDAAQSFQTALSINPEFLAASTQLEQIQARLQTSRRNEPQLEAADWAALASISGTPNLHQPAATTGTYQPKPASEPLPPAQEPSQSVEMMTVVDLGPDTDEVSREPSRQPQRATQASAQQSAQSVEHVSLVSDMSPEDQETLNELKSGCSLAEVEASRQSTPTVAAAPDRESRSVQKTQAAPNPPTSKSQEKVQTVSLIEDMGPSDRAILNEMSNKEAAKPKVVSPAIATHKTRSHASHHEKKQEKSKAAPVRESKAAVAEMTPMEPMTAKPARNPAPQATHVSLVGDMSAEDMAELKAIQRSKPAADLANTADAKAKTGKSSSKQKDPMVAEMVPVEPATKSDAKAIPASAEEPAPDADKKSKKGKDSKVKNKPTAERGKAKEDDAPASDTSASADRDAKVEEPEVIETMHPVEDSGSGDPAAQASRGS